MILAALFWPVSHLDAQPDRWARLPLFLLYLTNPILLFFLFTACLQTPRDFRDYRTLLDTHKAMKNGLPPQQSPGPGKKVVLGNIAQLILAPVLVLSLIMNYTISQSKEIAQFDLPYVTLSDMEDVPLSTFKELFGADTLTSVDENQARRQFSLLSPVWYEVSQSGYSVEAGTQPNSFSPDPENGIHRYSPDLDMTRFSLLIPALSRSMAKAKLDTYRLINLYWTYEEVDYPGTDFVILAHEDGGVWQMAALGSGGHVAVFRYGGQEKLAEHLDLLSIMVNP